MGADGATAWALSEGRLGDGCAGALCAANSGAVFSWGRSCRREHRASLEELCGRGFVLESLDASDAAYLPDLNRARAEASERSGLNASAPITVRAFASTPAFREATLAPGWVAAFTEGDWIGTQPLRTLATRHFWPERCAMSFCTRWWSNRPALTRHCGCVKGWWKRGASRSAQRNTPPALKYRRGRCRAGACVH